MGVGRLRETFFDDLKHCERLKDIIVTDTLVRCALIFLTDTHWIQ